MNVENGFYDSSNDKVTIKVEFQFKQWIFLIKLQFSKKSIDFIKKYCIVILFSI